MYLGDLHLSVITNDMQLLLHVLRLWAELIRLQTLSDCVHSSQELEHLFNSLEKS